MNEERHVPRTHGNTEHSQLAIRCTQVTLNHQTDSMLFTKDFCLPTTQLDDDLTTTTPIPAHSRINGSLLPTNGTLVTLYGIRQNDTLPSSVMAVQVHHGAFVYTLTGGFLLDVTINCLSLLIAMLYVHEWTPITLMTAHLMGTYAVAFLLLAIKTATTLNPQYYGCSLAGLRIVALGAARGAYFMQIALALIQHNALLNPLQSRYKLYCISDFRRWHIHLIAAFCIIIGTCIEIGYYGSFPLYGKSERLLHNKHCPSLNLTVFTLLFVSGCRSVSCQTSIVFDIRYRIADHIFILGPFYPLLILYGHMFMLVRRATADHERLRAESLAASSTGSRPSIVTVTSYLETNNNCFELKDERPTRSDSMTSGEFRVVAGPLPSNSSLLAIKLNQKAAKTTLIILTTLFVCDAMHWITDILYFVEYALGCSDLVSAQDEQCSNHSLSGWNGLLVAIQYSPIIKGVVDPIVFAYRYRDIRSALLRCYLRCKTFLRGNFKST